MVNLERILNAAVVIALCAILLAGFGVQIFMGEQPCPLCFLQRLGMISVALSLLLNLWFGVRTAHYGLAIFSALMGGLIALRHISLHVCPSFSAFGLPVLGLSLYTWSFLIFSCCVFSVALLLCLYDPRKSGQMPATLGLLEKSAGALTFFVASGNILAAFLQCGFGACSE